MQRFCININIFSTVCKTRKTTTNCVYVAIFQVQNTTYCVFTLYKGMHILYLYKYYTYSLIHKKGIAYTMSWNIILSYLITAIYVSRSIIQCGFVYNNNNNHQHSYNQVYELLFLPFEKWYLCQDIPYDVVLANASSFLCVSRAPLLDFLLYIYSTRWHWVIPQNNFLVSYYLLHILFSNILLVAKPLYILTQLLYLCTCTKIYIHYPIKGFIMFVCKNLDNLTLLY